MRSAYFGLVLRLVLIINNTITFRMNKEEITRSVKEAVNLGRRYLHLEIDYLKLSFSEKVTLILSGLGLGLIICMLILFTILMAAMALAVTLRSFLSPWLAYLCVGMVFLILAAVLFLFRKQILINPISKFITKIILNDKIDGNE